METNIKRMKQQGYGTILNTTRLTLKYKKD